MLSSKIVISGEFTSKSTNLVFGWGTDRRADAFAVDGIIVSRCWRFIAASFFALAYAALDGDKRWRIFTGGVVPIF